MCKIKNRKEAKCTVIENQQTMKTKCNKGGKKQRIFSTSMKYENDRRKLEPLNSTPSVNCNQKTHTAGENAGVTWLPADLAHRSSN